MRTLRYSLWGYNTREVGESISDLEEEIRQLRDQNASQVRELDDLRNQLRKSKAEEELIREAIVDAKHLSKRLVREAKEKATELLFEAEKDITEQFEDFDKSLKTLNSLREHLVNQKANLEQELKDTLERYRESLKAAETETFARINRDMVDCFDTIEEAKETSKQVILLPREASAESAAEKFVEKVVEIEETQTTDTDIPVYSFL